MPSLKDLKNRISSVKSTRKITSAMKMVAASKLRRAQEQAEGARPYAEALERMLCAVSAELRDHDQDLPALMKPKEHDQSVLLIVITSDRGLCGGFNSSVVREARHQIKLLEMEGKTVRLMCIGRKGREILRREYGRLMVDETIEIVGKRPVYEDAEKIMAVVLELYEEGFFDSCRMIYNSFKSIMSQVVTAAQLVPVDVTHAQKAANQNDALLLPVPMIIYEPDAATLLKQLLPRHMAVQVYGALLENLAGEMAARMTAMDNATRNAGDMIDRLTLQYNRSRQAAITKELIEIISGAEAV